MEGTCLFAVRDAAAMRRFADRMGLMAEFAGDGAAALSLLRRMRPEVLIVEAVLPKMDGLAVADAARSGGMLCAGRIIGGAAGTGDGDAFRKRDIRAVSALPWDYASLEECILRAEQNEGMPDWTAAKPRFERALALLDGLGMPSALRGREYLAWAAALSGGRPVQRVGKTLYAPIAGHLHTTPQNVERLIRHAIESMMNGSGAGEVYRRFGNSIDPAKGKPTNAQMIAMVGEGIKSGKRQTG